MIKKNIRNYKLQNLALEFLPLSLYYTSSEKLKNNTILKKASFFKSDLHQSSKVETKKLSKPISLIIK